MKWLPNRKTRVQSGCLLTDGKKGGYHVFVNSIELQQFRNYEHLKLDSFGPVNLLIGQNAQGKTNLAEAIFVLALTKSHRTSRDKELIRFGEDRSRLTAEVDKNTEQSNWSFPCRSKAKKQKSTGWSSEN